MVPSQWKLPRDTFLHSPSFLLQLSRRVSQWTREDTPCARSQPTLLLVQHQQRRRALPARAVINEKGFRGTTCHVKEKTDFSEHPVNAGKKERKGN